MSTPFEERQRELGGVGEIKDEADLERFVKRLLEREGIRALPVTKRFGNSSATLTAAASSPQITIPHGLGAVPTKVLLSLKQPNVGLFILWESAAADATNIYVTVRQAQNTAVTATVAFYWEAEL